MSLPETEKRSVESALPAYCESRVPDHIKDKLRLNFRIEGNAITLFEERPSVLDKTRWTESVVARFRYHQKRKEWQLYWADKNRRWHIYEELPPKKSIQSLLDEIERDPAHIFWG